MTPTRTPRTESPATDFSVALLDELVTLGVRDLVLAPGSRSQALALAAAEFARLGELRLHVRFDERVAGFLALGLAIETDAPVPIVTTSGTAVANLHPAVLEAHHSGVPLIVLSADRPEELRGIGANQTTVQPGIFAGAVRREWDVPAPTDASAAPALAREVVAAAARGPVHVNLQFREPLSAAFQLAPRPAPPAESWLPHDLDPSPTTTRRAGDDTPRPPAASRPADGVSPGSSAGVLELRPEPGTIVVAGTGAGERAEEVARQLGAPLLAEVTSGAHFGPNLVVAYRELLGTGNFGDRVSRVVVFGHPTLSREVPAVIQRRGVQTIVVRGPGVEDYNPGHAVTRFADAVAVVEGAVDRAWPGRWVAASRALLEPEVRDSRELSPSQYARAQMQALREPVTRRMLAEAAWNSTWPHDRLVLGASRLIREVDRVAQGKRIRVHANRGLAGIDGTVSTALGIALSSQARTGRESAGTTRVLLGDLALLHDSGALALPPGEPRPRIQVIVGNDRGGTIFDGLEVAATAEREAFDRVMLTPHEVDLAALAAAYGWAHVLVTNRGELDQALTAPTGPTIVEVPLPR